MKATTVSVTLTFVHLSLIVQGLDTTASEKNSTADFGRRIIYGEIANPLDFEFLLQLYKGDMVCGGTVIGRYFILTAAHCIIDYECTAIEIFPPTWMKGTTPIFQAVECYVSEKYMGGLTFYYDIGLIKTRLDLLLFEGIRRMTLPQPGFRYPPGTPAVVVGWGKTEHKTFPEHLMRADVQVEDWNRCNYKYKLSRPSCISNAVCHTRDIPKRSLCTQGQGPKPSGSCQGDSGGPLIIDGVVAGVVIGTIAENNDCAIGSPSLHTSVADFLPWIYSIIAPGMDTSHIPVIEESY